VWIKIVFINGSRADFGLTQSIIRRASLDDRFETILFRVGHSLASEEDFKNGLSDVKIFKILTEIGVDTIQDSQHVPLAVSEIIHKITPLLSEIKPDIIFVPGDRFEIFACVIAGFYQNIPIAHIFGGDRSSGGHFDDHIRHAITKLSHLHFTVCDDSYQRVLRLGEERNRVYNFGSPVIDNLKEVDFKRPHDDDFALMTYHPISSMPERSYDDVMVILNALGQRGLKTFITAPNNEFSSEDILRAINQSTELYSNLTYVGNLGWNTYLNYLKYAKFAIGNSSSHLLEAPILGTAAIDVGPRQKGRYSPKSVLRTPCELKSINNGIRSITNLDASAYEHPYGNGDVGKKLLREISQWLQTGNLLKKKISY